ncbi:MbnP family protein [Sediminibacterium sp.]|uniref:MbnP family protein n=1 Tax=Sediminibacterium sp. TaxID=1917865 RepID=UPI003F716B45
MQQNRKKIIVFLQCFFACTICYSQSSIQFNTYFNNQYWKEDSTYYNSAKEALQINRLMFYTSKWKAINSQNDTIELSKEHYLINIEDASSLQLPFLIPASTQKIVFNIGVDSIKNTTGIQTGVLDPAKGMFWTWRTGYIMAKMQGTSSNAATAGKRFSYEVGGFQSPYNTVRTIVLELTPNQAKKKAIFIETHLEKWFDGKHLIQIAESPNCHNAGKLAMQLADNYSTMFTIRSN